jgi:hypothetical protein
MFYKKINMIEKYSQQIEDIINFAAEGDLKIAVNKALKLALLTNNLTLANWLECEINGYFDNNQTYIKNRIVVPDYRKVVGIYLTADGINLNQYCEPKHNINFYYIREGVAELEVHLLKNATYHIEGQFEALSEIYKVTVSKFIVTSSSIVSILQAIRSKLIKEFIELNKYNKFDNDLMQMQTVSSVTTSFNTYIKQGEIIQAIKILETMTTQDDDNELLMLEVRFNRLERNRRKGTVVNADYEVEINRITAALVEFKKQVKER